MAFQAFILVEYDYIFTQTIIMRARIQITFLFLLSITTLNSSQSTSNHCEFIFSPQQQQQQLSFNRNAIQHLNSYFHEQKHIVNKIISNIFKSSSLLDQFKQKALQEIHTFNLAYQVTFLVLFIWAIAFLIIKRIKVKFSVLKKACHFWNHQNRLHIIAIILLIISSFIIVTSLKGIGQGEKTLKSFNNFFCQLFTEPEGFIHGGVGPQFNGYQNYYSQLHKFYAIYTNSTDFIRNQIFTKNKNVLQLIKLGNLIKKFIITSSSRQEMQIYGQQLDETLLFLQKLSTSMLARSQIDTTLFQFNQTIQFSFERVYLYETLIRTIDKYDSKTGNISKIISYSSYLTTSLYVSILFIGATLSACAALLIYKKKTFLYITQINPWLLYPLFALASICAIVFIVNTFAIPTLFWLKQSANFLTENQTNFKQFNQFTDINYRESSVIKHLMPYNKSLSTLNEGIYIKVIQQYNEFLQLYSSRDPQYFYRLYQKGASLIQDNKEINKLMELSLIKEPFIPFITQEQQAIEAIIETSSTGELASINISAVGNHLFKSLNHIFLFAFNRLYTNRSLCGNLSLLLFAAFLLSLIGIKLERNKQSSISGRSDGAEKQGDIELYTLQSLR